jgi:CBS domain-containing protein
MYIGDIDRLPVVDRNDPKRILGIISEHDLIRAHKMAEERPAE